MRIVVCGDCHQQQMGLPAGACAGGAAGAAVCLSLATKDRPIHRVRPAAVRVCVCVCVLPARPPLLPARPQVKCHACVGGTSVREDARILSAGVHVVVGTPGRVYDMLRRRCLRAGEV